MGDFIKNDKALVITAVWLIVTGYMVLSAIVFKNIDPSIINAALAGLFGVAVGQRLRAETPVVPTNNIEPKADPEKIMVPLKGGTL